MSGLTFCKKRRVMLNKELIQKANVDTSCKDSEFIASHRVFRSRLTLMTIGQHLSLPEIVKLRRVSHQLQNEFAFDIVCINFNVYFRYRNAYIKTIIQSTICPTMESVIMWNLQLINRSNGQFLFCAKHNYYRHKHNVC